MGLEGRKHIEKNFDRNIVVEEYLKEIESCDSSEYDRKSKKNY